MELRQLKFISDLDMRPIKRQKVEDEDIAVGGEDLRRGFLCSSPRVVARECQNATDSCLLLTLKTASEDSEVAAAEEEKEKAAAEVAEEEVEVEEVPKFGFTSVCGRRRDMEDAVSIHPSFVKKDEQRKTQSSGIHFYGVFDGHGCSHVIIQKHYPIFSFSIGE